VSANARSRGSAAVHGWPSGLPQRMWITLPEGRALRRVPWCLFIVLTFRQERISKRHWRPLVRNWIHRVSKDLLGIRNPEALRFIARYEEGGRTHRGHLHVCIADIPDATNTGHLRHTCASLWYKVSGAEAHVQRYDRSRDGIGYALKAPLASSNRDWADWDAARVEKDDDAPILSKSLLRHRCRTH
jgi:hypothetical protein